MNRQFSDRLLLSLVSLIVMLNLGAVNGLGASHDATPGYSVSADQSQAALNYAQRYVEHEVAYLLGGRLTVERYLEREAAGEEPGADIGVDASAVVVNAYRAAVPGLRFWTDREQTQMAADAGSRTLYHYSSSPIEYDAVRPGDLVFFQSDTGTIIGVGLFTHSTETSVHFIVASPTAGKVIHTHALKDGDYWQNSFAGFGRLSYTTR